MLIAAAWLHDIGMMVSAKAGETDETIREHHHERSREFIRRKLGPILNRKERACIAEIAYAHRMRVDITKIPQHQVITHPTLGSVNIRVQFLGGLLRLADVLDICYTRTGEFVDESRLSVLASFYHTIHERVSGITYNSGEGIIEIHIDARNKKEQMTLDKYIINEVQEELDSLQKVLARNG